LAINLVIINTEPWKHILLPSYILHAVFSGAASGYIILADYARGQQPTNVVGSSVNVSSLNNLPSPDSLAQNSKVSTLLDSSVPLCVGFLFDGIKLQLRQHGI
jgi:hypothetical protein